MNMLGIAGGAITVAPIIIDPLTGEEKKLRVTRRLKSNVKKAVEMFGVEFVAEQMGTDIEVIFYILTKKMRNDGPYVTKAAVRKTRQTVRKMKNLCDMYDDLRPAAKRRAPARAASRTRVVNVK
jgi:ribosome recycling factor